MIASSSDGYSRYSHTISKRSMFHSLTRRGLTPKNHQLLAQDEILGLKQRSPGEPRPDSKQQLGQKCDHRPLPLPYGHAHVIPDRVFGRHTTELAPLAARD
jgi:hypothetical protein